MNIIIFISRWDFEFSGSPYPVLLPGSLLGSERYVPLKDIISYRYHTGTKFTTSLGDC
jgi:hypothetical protein